jgi:hypothetical protein
MLKTGLPILILCLLSTTAFAQQENPLPHVQQESKYDKAPRFPEGPLAMMKYLEDSIQYSGTKQKGHVFLKFVVTKEGKIKDVILVNGIPGAPGLGKEAVRVVQGMPDWIPATKNGKPVDAEYYLSVFLPGKKPVEPQQNRNQNHSTPQNN